jgi:RHS repeat-associated protein
LLAAPAGNTTSDVPSPFGARSTQPDASFVTSFIQQPFDADLGFVRLGMRDYDPESGRFLQPDPLLLAVPELCVGNHTDCNLYSYARNNPANGVDPTGLNEETGASNCTDSPVGCQNVSGGEPPFVGPDPNYPRPPEPPAEPTDEPREPADPETGELVPGQNGTAAPGGWGAFGGAGAGAGNLGPSADFGSNLPSAPKGGWRATRLGAGAARLTLTQSASALEHAAFGLDLERAIQLAPIAAGATFALGAAWNWVGLIALRYWPLAPVAGGVVYGPYGQVARSTLEKAAAGGGPTTALMTRLQQAPAVGRALSTATGAGADALTRAAQATGQLFTANIPTRLIAELERIGLAERSNTMMTMMGETVQAIEYKFLPAASEFVVPFFR